jgi:BirA family biotin operon repressor/biotin-[acetyl-CoA-carboxylase] ligase
VVVAAGHRPLLLDRRSAAPSARARGDWPNDVFIGGRKCAGILVETSSKGAELGARVIGIGVNVNRRAFEGYEATSIALERGSDVDRIELFARACVALEHWLDRQERDGGAVVADAVRSRLAFRDQKVRVNDEEGTVRGVADDGALLFENARGTTRVLSGRIEPLG